jgi:hypothetical protein
MEYLILLGCHFNDGALRANHSWLFETARMVTTKRG